jgi:hypothetical protein
MKNFQLGEKVKNKQLKNFERDQVLKAFKRMGFVSDHEAGYVTVLRNSNFPFQRVVLPTTKTIHIELLKLYVQDLGFPIDQLIHFI